ncbi:MAG: efflux RND transporter periplasmic adaptor subunit, partial [Gammaproteobacteria bacterium]
MKRQNIISGLAVAAIGIVTIAVVVRESPTTDSMSTREHGDSAEAADFPRGPHGGRLLEDGAFALEVVIWESGIPPEFRLYGYAGGSALAPADFDAEITLFRLGAEPADFRFEPEMDYLRSIGVVREPHSFDVEVRARLDGQQFEWAYESHEGRTRIPDRVAAAQGIAVEPAGPATIRDVVELTGSVQIDPGRVSEIRARFPGIVTDVRRTVGDTVARGETLAMVETNESLRSVAISAPIAGLIVDRNIQPGQPTGEVPLFVVADLSEVWINLDVFGRDLEAIAPGQPVRVETLGGVRLDE